MIVYTFTGHPVIPFLIFSSVLEQINDCWCLIMVALLKSISNSHFMAFSIETNAIEMPFKSHILVGNGKIVNLSCYGFSSSSSISPVTLHCKCCYWASDLFREDMKWEYSYTVSANCLLLKWSNQYCTSTVFLSTYFCTCFHCFHWIVVTEIYLLFFCPSNSTTSFVILPRSGLHFAMAAL